MQTVMFLKEITVLQKVFFSVTERPLRFSVFLQERITRLLNKNEAVMSLKKSSNLLTVQA